MTTTTYSASREIAEVSSITTGQRPQTVITGNGFGGVDFDPRNAASKARGTCPRVRLYVEDEEATVGLVVFDERGFEIASARFNNMPAGVIVAAVAAYLA